MATYVMLVMKPNSPLVATIREKRHTQLADAQDHRNSSRKPKQGTVI
jgi:hypothetical protein